MWHWIFRAAVVGAGIHLCTAQLASSADPSAAEKKPNVLLITLDTLRADYLSCNGAKNVETPHLDRLAKDGANFTRARTSAPLTLPAHASIMTGNYPPVHGVRDNGAFRLPEEQLTLAEILQGQGYETAAFIGAFVLDRQFGLAQGFGNYEEGSWDSGGGVNSLAAERRGGTVYDDFSTWLENRAEKKPFFAWVHLYDPHAPHDPPEPFRKKYTDNPYAGEVAYTDAVVGMIVEDIEARELLDSTLIAVVGDHGEGLGEHGERTHSLLIYNSTIHVPMLLHFPGHIPSGKKIDHLTRAIDLAPTILDYLGLPSTIGQGASLRSLIDGKQLDEEIVAYSESLYASLNLGWSGLRALEADNHRFILAPRQELYDLGKDPGERVNLIDSQPKTGEALESGLASLMEAMGSSESHVGPTVDPQTEEMLRRLGYISTSQHPPHADSSVVDPKDRTELWGDIEIGLHYYSQGDYAKALDILNKALAQDKDIPILYEHIGWSYVQLNRFDEAERVYRGALERGIESADLHADLGLLYSRRGDFAKAETELRTALTLEEANVDAHYRLADVFRAMKNYPKAVAHYRRVLEIDSKYVYAANGMAMALALSGKNQEALTAFRRAIEIAPEMAPGYLNLAIHLERMQRYSEALAEYEKFMDLSSGSGFDRERGIATAAIKRLQAR